VRANVGKRYDRATVRTVLDATDERVLELLVADGRRSASEVGRRVNLSPAAAKRRIDRLERLGVIGGYRALIDHSKLGNVVEAFIELRFEGRTQVDEITSTLVDIPELVEAFTIAGDPDALVRVRVAELHQLKQVVDRIRRTGKVTSTKTLVVLAASGNPPPVPPPA
jgi:Lrp/AsnC family leucine-responsive transcriptional regulator